MTEDLMVAVNASVTLRPDDKLVFRRNWDDAAAWMQGAKTILKILAGLAAG